MKDEDKTQDSTGSDSSRCYAVSPPWEAMATAADPDHENPYQFLESWETWMDGQLFDLEELPGDLKHELFVTMGVAAMQSTIKQETCFWHADGVCESSCGYCFGFNDDGPDENGWKFCPSCGCPLEFISGDDESA